MILCGNTTQALDLAAHVMAHRKGVTLVSLMEHHSNDLPHRARGRVVHFGVKDDGTLDYDDLEAKLREHEVKLVAVTGASNVTGYLPDIHRIARMAHARGAKILVDGAQLLAHAPFDVLPDADPGHVDFFAGAGHKAYAPFGSSFLFGPTDLLDEAPPYIPAGGTVVYVTEDEAYYKKSPDRHEGGTPEHRRRRGSRRGPALPRGDRDGGGARPRAGARRASDGRAPEARRREAARPPRPRPADRRALADDRRHPPRAGRQHPEPRGGHRRAQRLLLRPPVPAPAPRPHGHERAAQKLVAGEEVDLPGAIRPSFGIFNDEDEVDELLRMLRVIRDRAWKGEYGDIPGAAACKEL